MKQMKLWMLGILISSLGLFTACSSVDLPVVKPEQGAAFRAMLKSLDWGTDTTFVYILAWRIPWTEDSSQLQVHWVAKSQTHLSDLYT